MHICDPTITHTVHPLGTGRYILNRDAGPKVMVPTMRICDECVALYELGTCFECASELSSAMFSFLFWFCNS